MFDLRTIVRENVKNMKAYSSARDEFQGSATTFLDANEYPFGKNTRYPDPYQNKLKSKLAELKGVALENIFVGNGSDEVIDLIFRIFCSPSKDKALTFMPTYGMYKVSANINDVDVLEIPLDSNFEIKKEELNPYFINPAVKVIFICSPNNPTGNSISQETIEWIATRFRGVLVIDEAYIDFSEKKSMINLINQFPNVIVLQTMSKSWGLASARVGFAFSDKEIIQLFNKIKPPYNVSLFNQEKAIEKLQNDQILQSGLQVLKENKEFLQSELENINIVEKVYPSDANFLLVQFNIDPDQIYAYLIENGIVIRNRNSQIPNCMRISIGTKKELELVLKTLKELKDEKSTIYRQRRNISN